MAMVSTSAEQAVAAADAWSKQYGNIADPANLTQTARSEYATQQLRKGIPSTEWDLGEFGKSAAHSLVDMLSYLPELGGTLLGVIDNDYDENDWESTGKRIADNIAHWMRDSMDKALPEHYQKMDFETAKESWNNGNVGDMLRFMRDSTPQAAVYMGAAMFAGGVPLFFSEMQRVLKDRMGRQDMPTSDADIKDFVLAGGAAALNVFLERMPIVKAMKYTGKLSKSKYLVSESVTEFGQGTAEEILVTVDTPAGVDLSQAYQEGLAEMIGGMGVIGATAPVMGMANKRNIKVKEAIKVAKEEALDNIDSETDAAIAAISEKGRKGERITREDEKEIRRIKKDARNKKKAIKKAKSLAAVQALAPVDVDLTPVEEKSAEELEAEARDETPAAPLTATEAASEIDIVDAEINKIKEQVKERQKIKGRKRAGYTEQEANEVAELEARKREAQKIVDRDQGVPPPTNREEAITRIAEIDAEIDALQSEQETSPGSGFTYLAVREGTREKIRALTIEKRNLQKILRGSATTPPREAETPTTRRPTRRAPEEAATATEQRSPVIQEAPVTDPAQLDRRVRTLDRQRAAENRAKSRRWERAQRRRQQRAAREQANRDSQANTPVVSTPGLPAPSLTIGDVNVNDPLAQEETRTVGMLDRGRQRVAQLQAEQEAEERAAVAEERAAWDANEREALQRQADIEEANRKEANIASIKAAQVEAGSVVDSFREDVANPDIKSPSATEMRTEKNNIAKTIENVDARQEFTERVEMGIRDIENEKRQAIKDRKDAAAEAKKDEAAKEEATRSEVAPTTEPQGRLTLEQFQSEYERIEREEGEAAARTYLKNEFAKVAVEETTGGMPAVDPEPTEEAADSPVKGDTITVYDPLGQPIEVIVDSVSEFGTIRILLPDGKTDILDMSEYRSADMSSPDYVLNMSMHQDKKVGELSDAELEEATVRLEELVAADPEFTQPARSWDALTDLNAVRTEKTRRLSEATAEEAKAAEPETKAEEKVEEDVGVEEQTADEQTQEMLDNEQARIDREAEEQAEAAREEELAEDAGPAVETEVEAEVDTQVEPEVDTEVETEVVEDTGPVLREVIEDVSDEKKQEEKVVKFVSRKIAGTTSWRGRVGGLMARVTAAPDGKFDVTYDDAPVEGERFDTPRQAQDFLIGEFGWPGQQRAWDKRRSSPKAETLDQEDVVVDDQKAVNNPYVEETLNDNDVPVQVSNQPEEGEANDWLVLVDGEPFARRKTVLSAVKIARDVTDADRQQAVIDIQEERVDEKEGIERSDVESLMSMGWTREDAEKEAPEIRKKHKELSESIKGVSVYVSGREKKVNLDEWASNVGIEATSRDGVAWDGEIEFDVNYDQAVYTALEDPRNSAESLEVFYKSTEGRTEDTAADEGIDLEVDEEVDVEADEAVEIGVSDTVREAVAARMAGRVETEIDDDSDLGWGPEQAELDALNDKEVRDRRKEKKADDNRNKIDPTYVLNEENSASLSDKLSETESNGGYSAVQIKTLAANIKKIDDSFKYNPKGKRGDVVASILEWHSKPALDNYEAQSKDNLSEYEQLSNDDVIESRRRDSTPEFLPADKASASINRAFEGVFGRKAARRMRETNFVNIITYSAAREMGASKTAQAFVSRANGSIYFIRDRMSVNMDDRAMRGLIFHEMGVHLGRDIFSGTEWRQVLNELYLLDKNNDPIVNAAVARVMKGYDYKKIDAGRPSLKGVNFEGRSKFWEEVLAHVVEMKQPGDIIVNKSLSDKIRSAFRKFFEKVARTFSMESTTPSVDLDDLVNLVGYATTQAGVIGLARHGDSKTMERFRDKKRSEFIKDSHVQHPVFHGTKRDWTHTVLERTELGLHVGTSLAALDRVARSEELSYESKKNLEGVEDGVDVIVVEAFTPGWENKISNKMLGNYFINYPAPSAKLSYPPPGATIKQGYINIKNPLFVTRDLGEWSNPTAWFNYANSVEAEGDMTKFEMAMGDTSYDIPLGEEGIALDMTPKSDTMVKISQLARMHHSLKLKATSAASLNNIEIKFQEKLRGILKSEGYDSIEYINASEDKGSKSYILLDDNMFKSVDDFAYDGTSIFSTRKAINQSNESEIVESRRMADEAAKDTALSRLGSARVDSIGKWIQRRIEPLMTIPGYDLLETQRMLAKGSVGDWHNKGAVIFQVLNEATAKEKKAIFKYFTTRGDDASKLPDRKVQFAEHESVVRGRRAGDRTYTKTVSIRSKVVEVKKDIEKMGQDLVDEGFISEEQYAEWKNRYLPRVYIEHVMTGADKAGFGLSMSPLTYTKTRKEHESFMKDLVSGRIDDPAFLASRYMSMAGADMATKKYMDYIASDPGNHGWVLPKQIMNFKGMNGTSDYFLSLAQEMDYRASILEEPKGKFEPRKDIVDPKKAKEMRSLASQMRAQALSTTEELRGVDTSKYVKVPNTARYGNMRGLYVMKDIWTDINGLGLAGNPTWGKWLQWSGRAQKVFKYTKVPMNIPTQVRNIVSNTVLLNVSGTNMLKIPFVVSQAVHDVSTNGKYMQIARKYGLESTTFASEELVKIDRELSKIKSDRKSFEGMWARTKVFFDNYLDVGGRAYQKTEVLFKVAKIIDLMENHGKTEAEAAKLANEALLDYSNVSQGIRLLRTMPLGSPFVTFNLKAAAQMVRNLKQHPFAVGKYVALPFLMAEMFLSQNDDLDDDDWDSLMEFLPDYMETSMSTMVFPYKNDQNKWEAVDISFFLPWGAHLNLAKNAFKGEFGEAVKTTGMFAGPWEISGALKLNEDPFTGQPIYNEADPTMQRYEDMLGFLASYMVPPMLWPRNRAGDIVKGGGPLVKTMMAADFIDGNIGKDGLPRYTMPNALLSWFGVSVQQLSEEDVYKKAHYKQKDLDKINRRFQKMILDPAVSGNSRDAIEKRRELQNTYREHWMKKYLEASEWAEHLKDIDKLFK